MRSLKVLLTLVLSLCLTGMAFATPSTQIWIPSTDIQKFKTFHLGMDSYITVGEEAGITTTDLGITAGVLPFEKVQAEVGIDYKDFNGDHTNPYYFNAKVATPEGSLFTGSPAIAAGGYDFGTESDVTDYNVMYGLVAKTLGKAGRLSAGYFTGNEDLLGADENSGLLLSWDRTITEVSDKLWAAVDYQGGESGYGALSFGVAWAFAPNTSVIFGYDIYNNDAIDPTATVQLDINF